MKKIMISVVLCILLCVTFMSPTAFAASEWNGSGTSANPYIISTEADLQLLSERVAAGNPYSGICFKVSKDISLQNSWTPIGTSETMFRGTFDGNGKTISGMVVSGDYSGLFAYIGSGANIKNVNLTEFSVSGQKYLAGLVAYADSGDGSISISNCSVDGTMRNISGTYNDNGAYVRPEYFAGITAYANATNGSITISDCTSRGSYYCFWYNGGIVGYGTCTDKSLKILNSTNYAYICPGSNGNHCGGIAGYLSSAELEGCTNSGSVSGNAYSEENGSSWLGGIVGGGSGNTFIGCGNYGTVSTFFAAGLSPEQSANHKVISCLNVGTLKYSSDGYGYGLVCSGTAINSYYLSGNGGGTSGADRVTAEQLASGEIAYLLSDYFGQIIGVDEWPVPRTTDNHVYKVTVTGEVSKTYYVNYDGNIDLPELSSCVSYYDGNTIFDPDTTITRDYALIAQGYHNYVDDVCSDCGAADTGIWGMGSCGPAAVWSMCNDGTLTISGSGAMTDYASEDEVPWHKFADSITNVAIGSSITSIGDYSFSGCSALTGISGAATVASIGDYAFADCDSLTTYTIPDSVKHIGSGAFSSCRSLSEVYFGKYAQTIGDYSFSGCDALSYITSFPSTLTSVGDYAFYGCSALDYVVFNSDLDSIGSYSFADCTDLYEITLKNVSSIKDYAFSGCTGLYSVTFYGEAPTSIGSNAFKGCETYCIYPPAAKNWTESIKQNYGGTINWALGCGDLWSNLFWILEEDGILTISGTGVMSDFTSSSFASSTAPWYELRESVKSVVICDGVTSIGNRAFWGCTNLTSVSMPDSLTKIGSSSSYHGYSFVFYGCASLKQINIPKNVTSIGLADFAYCSSLTDITVDSNNSTYTSVDGVLFSKYMGTLHCYPSGKSGTYTIPSSVSTIDEGAFYSCVALTSINLNNVDTIGTYAFYGCSGITELEIPSNVTSIEDYAFSQCTNLKTIRFCGSAPAIDSYAFSSVTSDVTCPTDDTSWTSINMKNYGGTLSWYAASGTCGDNLTWRLSYVNGSGVLTISGTGAMTNYTTATLPWKNHMLTIFKVNISDGVTSISDFAFSSSKITEITIPDSVKSIGNYAFSACSSLSTLTLGSSLTSIGNYAFSAASSLKSVVIPASVTSIGSYAFRNCTTLQYLEFLGNAPSIGTSAFEGTEIHAYYLASKSGWASKVGSNYGGTVTWGIISSRGTCGNSTGWILDTDGNLLICGSGYMKDHSSAPGTPWYSLRDNIKSVVVGNGIYSIGEYAFSDCTSLSVVTVPATINYVESRAFANCSDLQVVIFKGKAPSFDYYSFSKTACEIWYDSSATGWTSKVGSHYNGTLTWRCISSSGKCGQYAIWGIDSTGTLVVLGTGAMSSFTSGTQPWYSNLSSISSVIVGGEVTSVGNYAFYGFTNLKSATISGNVSSIGTYVFRSCTVLKTITFQGDAPSSISSNSFGYVTANAYYPINNSTWTSSKKANYGGTLSWNTYCIEHNVVADAAVKPTCTKTGLTEGSHCSVCGEVLVAQSSIAAKGHTEVIDTAVSATCTTSGKTEGKHCSVCNTVLVAQTVIPARHTEAVDAAVDPTCTIGGLTEGKHCSVCNEVLIAQEEVSALGHRVIVELPKPESPLSIENTNSVPFVLTDGVYYSNNHTHSSSSQLSIIASEACTLILNYGVSSESNYDKLYVLHSSTQKDVISGTVSNKTLTLSLAANDTVIIRYTKDSSVSNNDDRGWVSFDYELPLHESHADILADTIDPDCTTAVICDYCHTVVKAALGHTEVIVPGTEPDCTNSGISEGKHCSVCNEILIAQETVPALGHVEILHDAQSPTCTGIGWNAYMTCSRCDYSTYEELEATGEHIFTSYVYNNDATCDADGTETSNCDYDCGESISRTVENSKLHHSFEPDGVCIRCGKSEEILPFRFEVSQSKGKPGDTVELHIDIEGNPGIAAAEMKLSYDSDKLSLLKATDTGLLNGGVFSNDTDTNPYLLRWADTAATENNVNNGTLVLLEFQITENCPSGMLPVSLELSSDGIYSISSDVIYASSVNGYIEVTDRTPGDVNSDGEVTMMDSTILRRWLANWSDVTIDESNADVNGDGEVTMMDSTILRRYLANWSGVELK